MRRTLFLGLFGLAGIVIALTWLLPLTLSDKPTASNSPGRHPRLSVQIRGDSADTAGIASSGDAAVCYFDARVTLEDGRIAAVETSDYVVANRIRVGLPVKGLIEGLDAGKVIPLPIHIRPDGELYGSYAYCQGLSGELWSGIFSEGTGGQDTYKRCHMSAMVTVYDGRVDRVEAVEPGVRDLVERGDAVSDIPENHELAAKVAGPITVESDGSIRAGYEHCQEGLP